MFADFLSSGTTIGTEDVKYLPLTVLAYALYRFVITKFFLTPLSNFVNKDIRYKFIHRGFDCIHYIMSSIIGTLAMASRPYAHCPFYFVDCAEYIGCTGPAAVCSVFEKIYYFTFTSYYLSDILWLRTSPNGIKVLIFHHIMTCGMVYACGVVARPVIGFSIMLLHDWVDIFLYSGKITNYLGLKKASDVLMVIFAITFFYLRLFGCATILKIIFTEKLDQPHHYWTYLIARIFLGGLYLCHITWGLQILNALKKIFFKGDSIHDTRSDEPAADAKQEKKVEEVKEKAE